MNFHFLHPDLDPDQQMSSNNSNRRSALTASLAMSFSELQFVEALRKEPGSRNVQVSETWISRHFTFELWNFRVATLRICGHTPRMVHKGHLYKGQSVRVYGFIFECQFESSGLPPREDMAKHQVWFIRDIFIKDSQLGCMVLYLNFPPFCMSIWNFQSSHLANM